MALGVGRWALELVGDRDRQVVHKKQEKKAEAKQAYQAALKLNPTLKQASEALKRVS